MACLSKWKNENKTQRIRFPALITNIFIHGNFPLYGNHCLPALITLILCISVKEMTIILTMADLMSYYYSDVFNIPLCHYTLSFSRKCYYNLWNVIALVNSSNSCTDTNKWRRHQVHGKYYINTCRCKQQVVHYSWIEMKSIIAIAGGHKSGTMDNNSCILVKSPPVNVLTKFLRSKQSI